MARITNEELKHLLEHIRKGLPNGEFALLQKTVDDLQSGQKEMKDDLRELKKQLLDPDDGVITRVNKNSDNRKFWEARGTEVESAFSSITGLLAWQSGVNKALWISFSAIIGIIVKILIFPTI